MDYDDTQRAQHGLGDAEKRAWLLPPEHEDAAWQRLPRTCLISMRKLSEPARGSLCRQPSLAWLALPPTPHPHPYPTNPTPKLCRHVAQCNAEELLRHVAREKTCALLLEYPVYTLVPFCANPSPDPSHSSTPEPGPSPSP